MTTGHVITVHRDDREAGEAWYGTITCVCGWKRTATGQQEHPWSVPQPVGVVTVLEARWEEHRQQEHPELADRSLVG